jgi:hypothetical protein
MEMVLLIAGLVAALIGSVMIIAAAFRTSIVWGVASLLIPFAAFVFIGLNWGKAKAGFFWAAAGAALLFVGTMMAPGAEAATLDLIG